MRSRRKTESGAAAVEFALVLPVLLLIVIGTIEWGRYFTIRESVIHAVREGARAATLVGGTRGDGCGAVVSFLQAVVPVAACNGGGVAVDMNHTVNSGGETLQAVEVTVDVEYVPLSGLPVGLPSRLQVSAVMPVAVPP